MRIAINGFGRIGRAAFEIIVLLLGCTPSAASDPGEDGR